MENNNYNKAREVQSILVNTIWKKSCKQGSLFSYAGFALSVLCIIFLQVNKGKECNVWGGSTSSHVVKLYKYEPLGSTQSHYTLPTPLTHPIPPKKPSDWPQVTFSSIEQTH